VVGGGWGKKTKNTGLLSRFVKPRKEGVGLMRIQTQRRSTCDRVKKLTRDQKNESQHGKTIKEACYPLSAAHSQRREEERSRQEKNLEESGYSERKSSLE